MNNRANPGIMLAAVSSPAVTSVSTTAYLFPAQVQRLASIDVLRGLVMVLMALDHTRDFMTSLRFPPEDLAHTYGALFVTRFITHYCAPVFAFLAGTGAFLSTNRGKSLQELSRFFVTRGLWLVLLELTVVDFGWGLVSLGARRSDLDFRLEHGCYGAHCATSYALDRSSGIGHDRYSQSARSHQSGFVWKALLVVDASTLARPYSDHRSFFVLRPVRTDSVGRDYGPGLCLWKTAAPS